MKSMKLMKGVLGAWMSRGRMFYVDKSLWVILVFLAFPLAAGASDERLDPRERDEDISATTVNVEVSITPEGFYRYEYNVISSKENNARILSYRIDISCADSPDRGGLPDQPDSELFLGNSSADGLHSPVVLSSARAQAFSYGISRINEASWGLSREPGEASEGLVLLSNMPPVTRAYRLRPAIDLQEDIYNYDDVEVGDPEVPWIDDFTIHGMIEGPGCSADEPLRKKSPGSPVPHTALVRSVLISC